MKNKTQTLIIILFMGFLNNLFGQKKYSEDWNFYLTEIDGKKNSIRLNLDLKKSIPIKEKPNLSWISVKLNSPTDNGLTSNDESEILFKMEDHLLDKISSRNSLHIGILTTAGRRNFYFYSKNADVFKTEAEKATKEYPKYEMLVHSKEDKNWNTYLGLYPNEIDFQSISNRSVLENLEKNGDNLKKAREVFHWIYFGNEIERKKYIDEVVKENFEIVEENYNIEIELPFGLQIKRIDHVDYNNIDEYTLYLWQLAKKYGADYDGWETSVEKD